MNLRSTKLAVIRKEKACSFCARTVLALAIAVCIAAGSSSPRADPFVATLPVSVSGPTTVLEGTRGIEYTFAVTNNSGHDLNITSAFALIKYVSDDATDLIQFQMGFGFGEQDAFIPSGSVGHYTYGVAAPRVPDGTRDLGRYDLDLFIELSDMPRSMVPQRVGGFETAWYVGSPDGNEDPSAFRSLADCRSIPNRCFGPSGFLFPPSLNLGFDVFGGAATIAVTITDAPEPSSLGLVSTAVLVLTGLGWLNRKGAT